MKSSQIFLECERFLKRALKDKGQYTKGAVIAFLITGGIGVSVPSTVHAVVPTHLLWQAFQNMGVLGSYSGTTSAEKNQSILNSKVKDSNITFKDLYALLYHGPLATASTQTGTGLTVNQGYVTYQGSNIAGGEDVFLRGAGAIALGGNAHADGVGTLALGERAQAEGSDALAIGLTSKALAHESVAVGHDARSKSNYSLALGSYSAALGHGSNAVGYNTNAGSTASLALGYNTFANASTAGSEALASAIATNSSRLSADTMDKLGLFKLAEVNDKAADVALKSARINPATPATKIKELEDAYKLAHQKYTEAKTALEGQQDYIDLINDTDNTKLKTALDSAGTGGIGKFLNDNFNNNTELNDKVKSTVNTVVTTKGSNSLAIGNLTVAEGDGSIAQGVATVAKADGSIALGAAAQVAKNANQSIAVGVGAQAHDAQSIAMGVQSSTFGTGDVAIGNRAEVLGDNSVGIGYHSSVLAENGTAVGKSTKIGIGSVNSLSMGFATTVGKNAVDSVALGSQANVADGSKESIAIGKSAQALAKNSITLGANAAVNGLADKSIAIGNSSSTYAASSIVVGDNANVGTGGARSISIGNASSVAGADSLALGTSAKAKATDTIAIGNKATANRDQSIVIGKGASANRENSIVLGTGSTDYYRGKAPKLKVGANPYANYTDPTTVYEYGSDGNVVYEEQEGANVPSFLPRGTEAGKELQKLDALNLGVVSVGGGEVNVTIDGKEKTIHALRRITNVAPGALDTDAVTVAQLRAWRETDPHFLAVKNPTSKDLKVDGSTMKSVGYNLDASNSDLRNSNYENNQASGNFGMALGGFAKSTAAQATAIGYGSSAYDTDALAIGTISYARGNSSVAIGRAAKARTVKSMALGWGSDATGDSSIALGATTITEGAKAIAIGSSANSMAARGIAIGDGAKVQIDANSEGKDPASWGQWTAQNGVAIGYSALARRDQDVAIGKEAIVKGGDAIGLGHKVENYGENSIAIGSYAKVNTKDAASGTNSIAIGRAAEVTNKEAIALGADAKVKSDKSMAMGYKAEVEANATHSVVLGESAKIKTDAAYGTAMGQGATINTGATYGTAIGQGAQIDPNATYATAVGQGSRVQSSEGAALGKGATAAGAKTLALGSGASATAAGSVALGSESVAGAAAGTKGWDPAAGRVNNHTTAVSGAAASLSGLGSVSIGASGKERQITNLAAGSNDTDAVNVAQLKAVNLQIAGNTTATAGADVRLHNQTLNVVGDGTYLTSNAAGNTITMDLTQSIKNKINSIFVTSFTGDQGSKVTPTATSNTVNVTGKKFTTNSEPNSIWADGGVRYETGNIGTFTTGNTVAIGMRPELKSKSFTAYKYDGNNQTGEAGPSISYNNINMNDKPITNLQAGVNAGDAVNKSQLDAITWNLGAKGANGTIGRVAPSTDTNKRIDLVGDGGISVTASGSTVTISGSKILDSMPVVYTDAAGNRVYKHTDGKFYTTENPPAGTKPVADVQARLVNTAPGAGKTATTDATVFNNVKSVIEKQGVTGNTAPTFTDRLSVAATNNPTAAVNVKDLNSTVADLKNKELHITPMEYTPNANGDVTLSYSDGNGSVVPNTTATIKGVAKKSDLWNLSANGTKVAPKSGTVDLANGKNITITSEAGKVTIAAADQVESVTTATAATGDENIATVSMVTGNDKEANARYGVGVSKKKVADIAKDAIGVTSGSDNVTVTPDTTTTPGKTIYKVSVDKTKLDTGVNTTVTGAGTATDPYKVNVQGDLNKITSITNEAGNGKVAFGANGVSTFSSGTTGDKTVTINGKEGKVVVGNDGKPVTIDGSTGHVTGLQNTEWTVGTTTPVSGRAATEDQLKYVSDAVVGKADKTALWDLGVVATDGTSTKVTPQAVEGDNKRINLKGKGNVTVTADGNTITIEGENQNSIVVYTDAQGNRLYKRADGKFYKTKEPVAGERGVLANQVQSRLVNANGDSTTSPTVLNNVKSAIQTQGVGPDNLSPTFLERLEAAAKPTNNPNAAVNVSDLKSVVDAGMKYGANISEATGGANPVTNKLGSTVVIKGGATEANATNFDGTNVLTTVQQDEGNTTVNIKLKRDLGNIKSITNEAGNGKVAFSADGVTTFTSGAATGDKPVSIDGKLGKVVAGTGNTAVTLDGAAGQVLASGIRIGNQTATPTANGAAPAVGQPTGPAGNFITGLGNTTWNIENPTYVSGRAATEDQLKVLNTELNKKSSTDYRLIANPNTNDGAYTVSNAGEIDLTVKDEITKATNTVKLKDIASKTALDALVDRSITLGGDNNSATDKQTLANDVKFNIKGDNNYITTTAKGTDVTLTFNDSALAKKADEWNLAVNGTKVSPTDKQVNLVNGNNISITKEANGDVKVSATGLAKEDLSNITDDGKKVITGLGTEIAAGDRITVGNPTVDAKTGKKTYTINADKQVESVVKATLADTADENIAEVSPVTGDQDAANTKYGVAVSKKAVANIAKDAVEVKAGDNADNVHVTPDTTTAGKTIYKVSVDKTKLAAGDNTNVEGKGTEAKPYKVNVTGDLTKITSITNTTGTGKVSFAGDGVVKVDGAKAVSIDGKQGQITGLQNTTLTAADFAKANRAATEEQLKAVKDIADAASTTDYRLIANPVEGSNGAYKVDNGTISLKVKDAKQADSTPETITINDVASKEALDTVKANQWDLAVKSGATITNVTPQPGAKPTDNKRIAIEGADGVEVTQTDGVIKISAPRGTDNDTITTVKSSDGTISVDNVDGNTHAYDIKVNAQKLGEAQALIFVDDKGKQVFKQPDGAFKNADGTKYEGTVHTKVNTAAPQRVDNVGSAIDGAKVTTDAGQDKPDATYLEKLNKANADTPNAAVNVSDLKKTSDASIAKAVEDATTKGMKFQGNTGDVISKELGQTLAIKGEGTVAGNTAANNIRTTNNGGVLEIGLAESLTDINSIAGKGTSPLTISNGGTTLTINAPEGTKPGTISVGGAKITDVAEGIAGTDAVNVSQLNAVASKELHIKPTTDKETYTVDKNGNVTLTYVNGDGTAVADTKAVISGVAKNDLSNITDDGKKVITGLGTDIEAGTGITLGTTKEDPKTGKKTYIINADKQVESVTKADAETGDENIATVTMMDGTVDKTANARYGVGESKKAVANIAKDAVEVKA